ncbi:hypothetical protein [Jiella avicenniae]|uniref:Chromosome partitioning ATPase, Mrp family, contains Fe-S cluster n=1 Tax=Jiella avicenniae TaxID=2907202 RepID=A0A9X1T4P7_9HYPH|nr:hypothetical protein [Jiella avicenniae]MCE7028212.1 hypothetical protein [Jiella avicenniae]
MTIEQSRDARYDFEGVRAAASSHGPDLADRERSSKAGAPGRAASGEAGEQIATASELATAIQATDIVRIVVLSTHREFGSFGGLELARRLSSAHRGTVLIDLTPDGSIGGRMSLPPDSLGYADLLSGGAGLADIIYRDHYTSTHFVPAGGFEMEKAEEADLAHLGHVLDAFAEAYDYTVVEADPLDIPELPALLDETTAVVIAGLPHIDDRMIDVADDLRMIGIEDIVFMPMVRRQNEG